MEGHRHRRRAGWGLCAETENPSCETPLRLTTLDEPRLRPRPGAQRIDGRTIDVDDDHLQVGWCGAHAAIGRRRHGPLCCRRANGALRFVLTIDYGPFSASHGNNHRGPYRPPILTRWGASERLPRAENQCAVRLQLMSGLVRIADSRQTSREVRKVPQKRPLNRI
jgi:hypothetical protein